MRAPRRSVLLLASVAAGAIIWLPGVLAASPPTVVFSGSPLLNLGTLSCPSAPDVTNLIIPAGGTVVFINHTGKAASLHVGSGQSSVPVNGSHTVTFITGGATLMVSMIPDCLADVGKHESMTVQVCSSQPSPTPTPGSMLPAARVTTGPKSTEDAHPTPTHTQSGHTPTTGKARKPSPIGSYIGAAPQTGGRQMVSEWLALIAAAGITCVGFIAGRRFLIDRGWLKSERP